MNHSDSERIASVLDSIGAKKTTFALADLLIINMCSVRQSAVDRIYGLTRKINNRKVFSVLTGCVLKREKIKLLNKFDLILDIKDINKLPEKLGKKKLINNNYLSISPTYFNNFSANIPIMTGCNNFCSYCVVPYVRGREVSRRKEDIICEVKNLIKRGYKEIWLLGQNVNSYKDFPGLLKTVNDIKGDFWIRFTSSHPKDFSDKVIEAMKGKKITPYLNLPVQAGDDSVLRRMNRPYTINQYKEIIKKIREEIPEIVLSTDIIVGFPGETERQFRNSKKLFGEIKYDMAYISEYSPRSGTVASKMKDDVARGEKHKRKLELNEILKKTALDINKKYIGKVVEALIDRKNKYWVGKTKSYKTVEIKSSKNLLGKFVKVKITKATPWGLSGKLYE